MKRPSWIPHIDLPRHTTTLAVVITAILLAAGVTSAWVGEQDFRSQKVQQAEAHASVLAASVSVALAFEEAPEAEQAISALRANPDVQAVGIYRFDGVPFALGSDDAHQPPASLSGPPEAHFEGDSAIATALVVQEGQELGRVYVRLGASAGAAQWMRYVGVGLLLVMAAILVGAITVSQLSLSSANMRLGRQAATLTEANEKLVNEMSARKKAERALAQSQKMEAIGQLTGGLAHDFNNILAAVSGGVRLLERSKDADRREQVRAGIAEAIERGARLTRQLLTFARGQNTEARIVDPCETIGLMLEMLRRSIGEDVGVDTSLAAASWHVQVDPNQFELVLLNLAVNARDAMPNGGRITITCQNVERMDTPAGEFVRVTIADTGTGMSQETIERAFEPFFTTKDVGKGTGLGLAQVYGFAQQSGGVAWIESELGQGTAVHIDLPRKEAPLASQVTSKHPAAGSQPVAPPAGAGRRLLVVEDDEAVARMVCGLLEAHGYVCERAGSGPDALAKTQRVDFDLVFSDVVMPGGMSGIDLARELRQTKPGLPILLTTGFSGKARLEPGEFEILHKPWTPEALLHAVHRRAAGRTPAGDEPEISPVIPQVAERST